MRRFLPFIIRESWQSLWNRWYGAVPHSLNKVLLFPYQLFHRLLADTLDDWSFLFSSVLRLHTVLFFVATACSIVYPRRIYRLIARFSALPQGWYVHSLGITESGQSLWNRWNGAVPHSLNKVLPVSYQLFHRLLAYTVLPCTFPSRP